MVNKTLLLLCFSLLILQARAAGIRGIEMYTTNISGNTYSVNAGIYTDLSWPDSVEVAIDWGDGINDTVVLGPGTHLIGFGVRSFLLDENHTFSSNGTYSVTLSIPYWESSILNMTDAFNKQIIVSSMITIDPLTGANIFYQYNSSYIAGNVTGNNYSLDLSVAEPDGDSIVIEQQPVSQLNVGTDYHYPSATFALGTEYISGTDYHYDNINMDGFFAVSFVTKEYRSGLLIATHTREFAFEYAEGMGLGDLTTTEQNISVFPNPASGTLYVRSAKNEDFSMTDFHGKLLLTGTTNSTKDISNLGAGVYFVKSGNSVVKLVKAE